jgi:hypothetical protein
MASKLEGGKSAAQLRRERETRVMDAIRLKKTDRVPVICGMGYFPAKNAGIPCSAAYYDYPAWYAAYKKTLTEFHADIIFAQNFTPGKALEILALHQTRWPGYGGMDPWQGHQAIEVEFMKADEYDAFLNDPSDYTFRRTLSRASDDLSGLAKLPKLSDFSGGLGAQMLARVMADPEVSGAFETLIRAGREFRRWEKRMGRFGRMMEACGYPQYFQGAAMPPYDIIANSMRGMQGTMKDIFRRPDKLLAACDKILQLTLARPMPRPSVLGHRRMFMTNTRGSDDFMSNKHFEKFYWPTFRKLVMALVERGATPCIFFEGNFTSRLEYLKEFPRGSVLVRLDTTDIFKAKELLRDHLCIQGNVPSSLLQMGTVEQVREYCRKLIDVVGEGGGFIISPRSSTDEVNPENLKAMIDFTHEYGVYRQG